MGYVYEKLTDDERKQIAEQQWKQFEGEIFGHELNLKRLAAMPVADTAEGREQQELLVKNSEEAIEVLTKTIEVTKVEAKRPTK